MVPFDLVFALTENAVANECQIDGYTEVQAINSGTGRLFVRTNQGGIGLSLSSTPPV